MQNWRWLASAGIVALGLVVNGAQGRYRAVELGGTLMIVDGLTGERVQCYVSRQVASAVALEDGGVDSQNCVVPGHTRYD